MLTPVVETFTAKRHMTLPKLSHTVTDASGDPVDLAGATSVTFIMYASEGAEKVSAAAVIEDAAAGLVSYSWGASDLDTGGEFHAEFDITLPAGKRTSPTNGIILVSIFDDLDDQ